MFFGWDNDLGGSRPSWIDKILLPHLCIVCFITFSKKIHFQSFDFFTPKELFRKCRGNILTLGSPPEPCWTNSTWSREIQFKLLKKSLLQRKEILMWRSNLLKSLPELSQVASSALPEEKFILLRATKFYLLPPSMCIKLAKIKFVAMYIWHNLKMFQISQFCETMFEASDAT